MNFADELRRRVKKIEDRLQNPSPAPSIPIVKYDLVIRDCEGKVIKTIAWGIGLKECLALSKHMEKSKLIKTSNGEYSLHYLKIEKGLYKKGDRNDNRRI